jgi:hypothetical protein
MPAGYVCDGAVDMSAGGTWTGSYADYDDLWDGTTGCGSASGPEAWFVATIPAGNVFTISETSTTDVVLQAALSCPTTTCWDYTDTPEAFEIYNDTGAPATMWFAVEKYYSGSTGALTLTTSNVPAPAGLACDVAIDISAAGSWTGNFSTYEDYSDRSSGCGWATGREIWFTATVPAGGSHTIAETSISDVVLQSLSSCAATTCLGYADSPETLTTTNSTGAARTYWFVVEQYSLSASGAVNLTITTTP